VKTRTRKKLPKPSPKTSGILRTDPTRTTVLRATFASSLTAAFAAVSKTVTRIVAEEDGFGLKSQPVANKEGPHHSTSSRHTFASTHFVIEDEAILRAVREMQARIDPADVVELEDRPHVTVRYGLDPSDASPFRVENLIKHSGPVFATTGPLSLFTSTNNVFCSTGPGGGVDPSCGSSDKSNTPKVHGVWSPEMRDDRYTKTLIESDQVSDKVVKKKIKEVTPGGKWPFPPVAVIRTSGTYDLKDGHHRIEVARRLGVAIIPATLVDPKAFGHTRPVNTFVEVSPDGRDNKVVQPDNENLPVIQVTVPENRPRKKLTTNSEPKPDVLKVTVVGWKLHDLNRKLKAIEHTEKFPTYQPHMTVAYLKPGTGKKYFGLQQFLPPGTPLRFTKLAYSDTDRHETDVTLNVFCATGEGGGVDPTCPKGGTNPGSRPLPHPTNAYDEDADGNSLLKQNVAYDHKLSLAEISRAESAMVSKQSWDWAKDRRIMNLLADESRLDKEVVVSRGLAFDTKEKAKEYADKLASKGWYETRKGDTDPIESFTTSQEIAERFAHKQSAQVMLGDRDAHGVILEIEPAKRGTRGYPFGVEAEVALPRGQAYKIRGIEERVSGAFTTYVVKMSHDTSVLTANTRWSGQPPSQKVNSFGSWLNALVAQTVTGPKAKNAWDVYLKTGFKKGVTSSYTDVTKASKAGAKKTATSLGWYSGAKDQFVQSAMANPLTADKVKMIANQAFDHLTDVTSTMSTRISRVLTDGLIKGLSPKVVAANIVTEVGLAKNRALLIAQTELIRAHAEGQLTALENAGIEEVSAAAEYDTSGLPTVCPKCKPLDGVVLTVAEARGMIPRHPGCKCAWKPAVVKAAGMITGASAIKKALKKADAEPNSPIAKKRPELMALNQMTPFSELLPTTDPIMKLLGACEALFLQLPEPTANFDPSQPRDAKGRWGTGGFRHDVSTPMSHLAQLGGSTGATLVESGGKKWVKKAGGGTKGSHIESEHYATKVYKVVGADVPGSSLHKANDAAEYVSKLSRYITGGKTYAEFKQTASPEDLAKMRKEAGKHFAMDALLGNWDVVGLSGDNMLVKGNRVYRIDNGGALKYRAQGQLKTAEQFNASVPEIHSMRDPSKNASAAEVFGHLTDAQVAFQMHKIVKDKDKILAAIPEAYGKSTIANRLETFQTMLASGFGKTPTTATPMPVVQPSKPTTPDTSHLKKDTFDKTFDAVDDHVTKMTPAEYHDLKVSLGLPNSASSYNVAKALAQKVHGETSVPTTPQPSTPPPPTSQGVHSPATATHLHSADGVHSYLKGKPGTGFTETDLQKVKYLNPNGIKDGAVLVPNFDKLDYLKKILPAGTIIKHVKVTKAQMAEGHDPKTLKPIGKPVPAVGDSNTATASTTPATPKATKSKVVLPPVTTPQPVHAQVSLDDSAGQVLKKVAKDLGTDKTKPFGPMHAKGIQTKLKEENVYMSLYDISEGLKADGYTTKPNAVFDKTTSKPEPGRLTKEQKKANIAANTSVVVNPDGTKTTTYFGHTFTQSPKALTPEQLAEQAPPIPGSNSTVNLSPENHVWDKKQHKDWVASLTPEEAHAISSWKGSSGNVRRNVAKHAGNGDLAASGKATALMSALAKQPPQPGVYYRGVSGPYATGFVETAKKALAAGRGWVADQLPHGLSANESTSHGFSSGHTFIRIISKSARPIINAPGGYQGEAELIVPPMTRYRVLAVHDNVKINSGKVKHVVELQEI